MIEHIKILIGFVCLLIGSGTILYLYQLSRKVTSPAIRYIFFYSIYMLLLFVGIVISKYIKLNLSVYPISRDTDILFNIGTLAIILIQLGMVYTLLVICLHLNRIEVHAIINIGFISMIVLIVGSYIVRILLGIYQIYPSGLYRLHSILWNDMAVLELPLLLFFLMYQSRSIDDKNRTINQIFAALYLSRFLVVLILLFLSQLVRHQIFSILFPAGFFLWYFFVPLIWVKFYYIPFANSLLNHVENETNLDTFYIQHDISKREQEILKLMIQGKTNREIADTLFIALPTVKNHIYSIYKKLKVNSRYQLIHMATTYSAQS